MGVGWQEIRSLPSTNPCHATVQGYQYIAALRLKVDGLVHRDWTVWIIRAAGIHMGLKEVDPIL